MHYAKLKEILDKSIDLKGQMNQAARRIIQKIINDYQATLGDGDASDAAILGYLNEGEFLKTASLTDFAVDDSFTVRFAIMTKITPRNLRVEPFEHVSSLTIAFGKFNNDETLVDAWRIPEKMKVSVVGKKIELNTQEAANHDYSDLIEYMVKPIYDALTKAYT